MTDAGRPDPICRKTSVAVVHDYCTQRGGAERVALAFARAFSDRALVTSLVDPSTTYPEIADFTVTELTPSWLGPLRRNHRVGVLVFPVVFTAARSTADITICSSSAFAHGIRASGAKVVYCHSPARWLYDERAAYLAGWPAPVALAMRAVGPLLRAWDRHRMASADLVIANSTATQQRIETAYGIEAPVVPPPPGLGPGPNRAVPDIEPGYLLSVGRLLAYKRVDAVIEAVRSRPYQRLVIVGDGPLAEALRDEAPDNCSFVGEVDDEQLRWLYANANALVSMAREDFGLTPIEAARWGVPSLTIRAGGFLDTVVDGTTGLHVDNIDPASIAAAIDAMAAHPWRSEDIEAHAERFDGNHFVERIAELIEPLREWPPRPDR